ncbi:calcium-binding protein [Tropicimonas marinistellae]|uniref:calcium-binding protein n=1 Tax=Tropicimonas marinistellae TaxID=1739787 RepID=UPI0008371A94|nr:calcium-binding protein [Tropicimonas marinistellae]
MGLLKIRGTSSDDTIRGIGRAEKIIASLGDDFVDARGGNDHVRGGEGRDGLLGGDGYDRLFGGHGDDLLAGQRHNDVLDGGDGNDILIGGTGSDRLIGDGGDDTMIGGTAEFELYEGVWYAHSAEGDGAKDTFVINEYAGDGNDEIYGFEPGTDVLLFKQNDIVSHRENLYGVTLTTATGGTVYLEHVWTEDIIGSVQGTDYFDDVLFDLG